MASHDPKLLVQPAPLLASGMTTPKAMRDLWYALLPALLAGFWFFGLSAVLVVLAAIAGCVLTEWTFTSPERRSLSLGDGSAVLTGLLLGMTLPPALPMWMAFLGGVVAIGLGKIAFGGLGANLFNPALVGRAFLLGTFPIAMTTWYHAHGPERFFDLYSSTLALPFMQAQWDAQSTASPLGLLKFQHQSSDIGQLFIGNVAGSLGETSALLLMLGGLWLWWRRDLDWRIPVAIALTAVAFSEALYLVNPERFPSPGFTLFSGGFMLGAIYMATDPVTSPLTPKGSWIFGIGIGLLVVLIRVFGGMPEGMMYAILLMNSTVPLINRVTQPRVFGRKRGQA